jgi:hypothetical protein
VNTFSISCKLKYVLDQYVWLFLGVYGPYADSERQNLWEELYGVFSRWELPWCVRGDFNITWFSEERVGLTRLTFAMWEFSNFISEQGFMDISLAGGSFTWSNNQDPLFVYDG